MVLTVAEEDRAIRVYPDAVRAREAAFQRIAIRAVALPSSAYHQFERAPLPVKPFRPVPAT